jgi:hypothetical protein
MFRANASRPFSNLSTVVSRQMICYSSLGPVVMACIALWSLNPGADDSGAAALLRS